MECPDHESGPSLAFAEHCTSIEENGVSRQAENLALRWVGRSVRVVPSAGRRR